MKESARLAYFSMEIGLEAAIPTYSGGLGILAGDTIRSAADAGIPLVAVTLLHRKGYFHQNLDETGWQTEEPVYWAVDDYLTLMPVEASVFIEDRKVSLRVWSYQVVGCNEQSVTVYFLDADVEGNSEIDRTLTHYLYGGDEYYRLCQEVILGIGGVKILRTLGHYDIARFHMNEGHASLLVLELMEEVLAKSGEASLTTEHLAQVRSMCVFTTHTPVPAGHDQFSMEMASKVLQTSKVFKQRCDLLSCDNRLNLTYLALDNSRYVNGVAKKHGDVSRLMFTGYQIDSITNGVHAASWASQPIQKMFDKHIPGWRQDNASLRYSLGISCDEIWSAHIASKKTLFEYVNRITNIGLDKDVMTIGYARRATPYKRPHLLFDDVERLKNIVEKNGPLQIIFAGKAHPHDHKGKELIQSIYRLTKNMGNNIRLIYMSEYDITLAKFLCSGVDIWLNTPEPPLEASGTSGMKAAINGVPSLSILDGWWIEGCIEGVTGWSIGDHHDVNPDPDAKLKLREQDANNLYSKLENVVLPMYYNNQENFIEIMRSAIAINGSFFNTERMLSQYITRAYFK